MGIPWGEAMEMDEQEAYAWGVMFNEIETGKTHNWMTGALE